MMRQKSCQVLASCPCPKNIKTVLDSELYPAVRRIESGQYTISTKSVDFFNTLVVTTTKIGLSSFLSLYDANNA